LSVVIRQLCSQKQDHFLTGFFTDIGRAEHTAGEPGRDDQLLQRQEQLNAGRKRDRSVDHQTTDPDQPAALAIRPTAQAAARDNDINNGKKCRDSSCILFALRKCSPKP